MQVLDEVEPGGVGVAHRTHGSGGPGAADRFVREIRSADRGFSGQNGAARGSRSHRRPAATRRCPCASPRPGRRRRAIQARAATPTVHRSCPLPVAGTTGATLLLNATYEPLCVVSSRRAIVLVLAEKAEPVDSTDDVVHAETVSLAVPVVVRLTRYVRVPYPSSVPLSRRAVFTRDGQTCVYCGGSATSIDHVVPRSRGGTHTWDNVVAACRRCNHTKADRSLAELGWSLPHPPRTPERRGVAAARAPHRRPALARVAGHARERERVTSPGTARRLWALGEPFHALTYFADEAGAAVRGGRACAASGRATSPAGRRRWAPSAPRW